MTSQLTSLLNIGPDNCIVFQIITLLMRKKPPKPSTKLRKKPCISIGKKHLKFHEKTKKKKRDSYDKKPSNSMRKQEEKPIILFAYGNKPLKPI